MILPYDMIYLIFDQIPLKTGRLINKTITNHFINKYLMQMIPVTSDELNHYIKEHDFGMYYEWHLSKLLVNHKIIDIKYNTYKRYIKIKDQEHSVFPYIGNRYQHLEHHIDLLTQYGILKARMQHDKMDYCKKKILSTLEYNLANMWSIGLFVRNYIWLAMNCHMMNLQDINCIDGKMIEHYNLDKYKPHMMKMYDMVLSYIMTNL